MKREEELERLLEDWLEDEARPMPHEVLESALESVARTSQTSSHPRGLDWIAGGPVGILSAAAVVVLLVVAGGLAVDRIGTWLPIGSGSSGQERVWNPVTDWLSAPNQENPSPDRYGHLGVWRYMRSTSASHDAALYILMPNFEGDQAWNQPGMSGTSPTVDEAWNEPAMINVFVALGTDEAIYLHPTVGAHAILAWTSPVAGKVRIEGVVARPQDPCSEPSGSLLFSIEQGSASLRALGLDLGQRADISVSSTVGLGETVYFVVDADGDAICDLTELRVTIRVSP
jgi:hypothetical protein